MTVSVIAVAILIGLLFGRLYSFVALLIVSPLVGLVGLAAMLSVQWPWRQAALGGIASIFVVQLAYLVGVRLRARAERRRIENSAAAASNRTTAVSPLSSRIGRSVEPK